VGFGDSELRVLERLMPTENGLTVFDAETQETSYGIHFFDGVPYIFDSHRKEGHYVATLELLTEIVEPIRISEDRLRRFCHDVRAHGLLPIPYSGCFFKGNLHVYAFSGTVRGFDLSAVGADLPRSERRLDERVGAIHRLIPTALKQAQRELLEGRRKVRHPEDLLVLEKKFPAVRGP
jgi:hypothetical protein